MTESSGEYPKLRAPKEWRMPLGWTLLFAAASGLIAYGFGTGQNGQRIADLEKHSQEQSAKLDAQSVQLAGHDVQIAVINQKLDVIIGQLDHVNAKLERAEQEHR